MTVADVIKRENDEMFERLYHRANKSRSTTPVVERTPEETEALVRALAEQFGYLPHSEWGS